MTPDNRIRGNIPHDKFVADTLYDLLQEQKKTNELLKAILETNVSLAPKNKKDSLCDKLRDILDDGKLNNSI